eukprot:TRINITY_DN15063_c0_g2_i1.p2 TRINITY_DN15063_c0_g2~~TRINITY_DN15063_c0_g2_i1.p2  ORF type:complete len:140 (+),score=10.40 TRINITY_DN15063_c0_g2_i1:277-696(+)
MMSPDHFRFEQTSTVDRSRKSRVVVSLLRDARLVEVVPERDASPSRHSVDPPQSPLHHHATLVEADLTLRFEVPNSSDLSSSFSTPTRPESRVSPALHCPGAPMKSRPSCRRRPSESLRRLLRPLNFEMDCESTGVRVL